MVQRKKSTKEQEVKTEVNKGKGKSPKKERKIEKADLSVQNEETILPEAGKEEAAPVTTKENSKYSIDELPENLCPDTDCAEDNEDCDNEEYGDAYDEIIKKFNKELEEIDKRNSKTERLLEGLERKRKEQEAWVDEFLNEED